MTEFIASEGKNGLKSLRIIVVDDEIPLLGMVVRLLERKLERLGFLDFGIIECVNGNEAIKAFDPNQTDIILTDVRMDGLDGVDMVNHLNSKFPNHRIPIIFMSGHLGENRTMEDLREAGMFRFIEKPSEIEVIMTAITDAIKEREGQGIIFNRTDIY